MAGKDLKPLCGHGYEPGKEELIRTKKRMLGPSQEIVQDLTER